MADNVMAIQVGRLSLSRITYICDLQRASTLVIPLGVIAEMAIGSMRALGLIARTELLEEETDAVGRLLRQKLAHPFDFLCKEFDWALSETRPGDALARLSQRYAESLFFAPPTQEDTKKVLPVSAAAAELVLSDLRRRRDEEFYLMLAETWGKPNVPPSRDMTQLAA